MEYVWVNPAVEDEFELPFGACIVERRKKQVKVRNDNGKESNVSISEIIGPMHPSCIKDVDDMILLGDLQEYTILRNLELRYKKNLIYTYASNVLVAVNPYQPLPLYGKDIIEKYRNKKQGELPPHLFAIGDISYENMRCGTEKQCIVINGESGAGKTQSVKLLLQYYSAITGTNSIVEEQILLSNPIIEAFGNAKTARNDNSSRFGKYVSINFNWEGKMEQAEIKQFLLEKSRIVIRSKGERNYHIFYMMMKGLSNEEKNCLGLKEVKFYSYLSEEETNLKTDELEKIEFQNLRRSLKILNFSENISWKIFELLAAILHFGNVEYNKTITSDMETVEVVDSSDLIKLSTLMGVSSHYLKSCLTKKTIGMLSDKVSKMLNKQEAVSARDAFVKAIYGNLFNFIVDKINETILRKKIEDIGYIGVLDVFGFENCEKNSFEQLCINLANESLQQFFIRHTFKREQEDYIEEGLQWTNIEFVDNTDIINMISVKPMNILSIINDQSKILNSTDESLLEKLIEHHVENEFFLTRKFSRMLVFGIIHFAGIVLYDIKDFLEKNRDSYSCDFLDLARMSDNSFLRKIFSRDIARDQRHIPAKKRTMQTTSATKFKNSLDSLMVELNECQPYFIRCIKPNDLQKPNLFDRRLCCQQLRYSGIWETSKIRRAGFSVRFTYREFVLRYRLLRPDIPVVNSLTQVELQEATRDICHSVIQSDLKKQFGYTRLFLRNVEYLKLEKEREKFLTSYVLVLQAAVRRWLCRKRYNALKTAAIVIQKNWRGRRIRKRYLTTRNGLLRLQATIRRRYQRISYLHLRYILLRFQARCKGFAVRRIFNRKLQTKNEKLKAIGHMGTTGTPFTLPTEKASTPMWKKYFTRGKPVKQDSYLHGRTTRIGTPDQITAFSKVVDDSFNFLNDHGKPRKTNRSYYRKY